MTLRLGGDGAITGCTSLENPDLTVSGLTISGSFDAEKVLVASGTAAAPSYTFSGDTDNGLYYAGTNSVGVSTAGTSAIIVDASQRVGIGTTSVSHKLDLLVGGGADGINVYNNATGAAYCQLVTTSRSYKLEATGSDLRFYDNTGSAERARIDSSGRLLVGTSTARSNFFNTASSAPQQFQVEGTSGNACSLASICSVADTSGGRLLLAHQRSGGVGGNTILNSGDQAGYITFQGNDGGEFVECASIEAIIDGTPGASDMPGRLVFSTTADGASSPTERLRITSDGKLILKDTVTQGLQTTYTNTEQCNIHFYETGVAAQYVRYLDIAPVGYSDGANNGGSGIRFFSNPSTTTTAVERMRITREGGFKVSNTGVYSLGTQSTHEVNHNQNNSAGFHVYHTGATSPYGYFLKFTAANPNNASNYVFTSMDNLGANIYTIYSNGTVTARSDAKFKKNIETTRDGYLEDLAQLRVVKYNWYNHDDDAPKELGFIAQEVEQVFPGLVSTMPDRDDQGNETDEVSKSIKTSVFTPMLVKALQEALKRIETLEAKVAALEAQ